MPGYSLVPVDYQPDFDGYSLVPVDYDPFAADGPAQQAQLQQPRQRAQGKPVEDDGGRDEREDRRHDERRTRHPRRL